MVMHINTHAPNTQKSSFMEPHGGKDTVFLRLATYLSHSKNMAHSIPYYTTPTKLISTFEN